MTTYSEKPFIDNYVIGREEEIVFLLKSIAGFENSDTSLLLVEGQAGIGKTTLIRKVLSDYKKPKCFKLYGKFSNQPGQIPYQDVCCLPPKSKWRRTDSI